jgi:hypothetical protein
MRRQRIEDPKRRLPLRARWQQWRMRRQAIRNARLVASARWRDDDRA